jgi:hypothetical protein
MKYLPFRWIVFCTVYDKPDGEMCQDARIAQRPLRVLMLHGILIQTGACQVRFMEGGFLNEVSLF